jgi:cellulose synthase/poly-beta-1,6-N-acetylglucosamine synthase-like glycosyltransferase
LFALDSTRNGMPTAMYVWLIACGLVGLTWSLRHRALNRASRGGGSLSPASFVPFPPDAPRLSVLVAAKDEEANIGTCVHTLLEQDYPNFEVIAINDRSGDRTGPILDEIAAQHHGRLKVVHITALPEGWFGKNNAMAEGVARADGEWLCFVDADCRQTSLHTLSVALREAMAQRIDFLSVLPVLETKSFWERLIQPVCAGIMLIWFNPERVNDPRSRAAYANGAFMLMSRATYDAIGGHNAVRTELNEDMHMAQRTKAAGRRLCVLENEGLYFTRMYSSFRECWRGWSRIFYGCFKTFPRLAATLGLLLASSIFPFISLLIAACGWLLADAAARPSWTIALAVTGAVVLTLESVIFRFMRRARAASWAWLTYAIGAGIGVGMLVAAMRKLGRAATTTWRGTTYPSASPAAPAGAVIVSSMAPAPAALRPAGANASPRTAVPLAAHVPAPAEAAADVV